MKIISIAGQMRSGKNMTGEYLCEKIKFKPASFANPVKKIFCDAFGVDIDFVEKWKVEQNFPPNFEKNVRQSLQFIGDGFRQIKSDVWIDYAIKNNPDYSCYMDGRYINELSKVRQQNGINILVWRPGYENNDPNQSEAQIRPIVEWFASKNIEGDVSGISKEQAPEGCQYINFFIMNNGTLENLYNKIDNLIISNLIRS